ncbi:Helix-turn-helix domain-containing protein [Jiangella alkaliphila]|uniref:Helix-turn-helix domain-containing protein n=1 Tax=Jiangella alkaliphila TaxID=419479 RepID=A0A1H2HPX1_9ACTN|nr:Helix-turn-helix domain-containing protein [Jiangella alkaliphila]
MFDETAVDQPLVQRVWWSTCEATTGFASAVKTSSMLAFARSPEGVTSVHLRGPEQSSAVVMCEEGWEFFGVEFRLGVYLPQFPPSALVDRQDALLPILPGDRIVLDNREWEMPTAQNVDVFVSRLARAGLLLLDPLVDDIQHGERPRGMSVRIAQLRFRRAVGLSHRKVSSIEQARKAAALLAAGGSIADAVIGGGYYDHPHLARAMRWATGQTPSELRSRISFLAL